MGLLRKTYAEINLKNVKENEIRKMPIYEEGKINIKGIIITLEL